VGGVAAAGSLVPVAIIGAAIGFLVFRRAQQSRTFEEILSKNLGLGMMNPLYDNQINFEENPLFLKPEEEARGGRASTSLDAIA